MQFEKLIISSRDLKTQQGFYEGLLGFSTLGSDSEKLVINAGATQLVFSSRTTTPVYHFAFLIPTGSLEAAIDFVESKGIELLPLRENKIIHFDSGRSIYFYDPDGNIAEFIERPGLSYPAKDTFQISDVIRINEIGHPVLDPLSESNKLISQYGIEPINPKAFRKNFCWVGDHEGAIIVVEKDRHWLPTDIPAVFNDFELEYAENGQRHRLKFESGDITFYEQSK